jgi:glutaredoxin 2
MRLYMFEHCPLCFRVRMMAALKRLHLEETVLVDDDSDTMIAVVGKRIIPILVRDDGTPMLGSMDMMGYVESHGDPVLIGRERSDVVKWADGVISKMAPLKMPRYPLPELPEFATGAALDHHTARKREALGDFIELRSTTRAYIKDLMPELEALDRLIESPHAINEILSLDDIRVLPCSARPRSSRDYAFRARLESISKQ